MLNLKYISIILIILIFILVFKKKYKYIEKMSNNNYIFREILKINNNSFEKIIDGSDENNCLKGINKDEAINFCNNDDKCNIIYTPTGGIGNEFCFKNKINKC